MRRCNRVHSGKGFTLLEMIIAISLLALVAILGWRSLDAMVRTRHALDERMAETHDMQLTFSQLQRDCAQLVPATLTGSRPTLHADASRLLLIRMVELDQQPVQLQVVSYVLREGVLTRTATQPTRDLPILDTQWLAAVNGGGVSPRVILQTGLTAMRLRLWSANAPGWQPANNAKSDSGSQWTGLEMSLDKSGHQGSIVKSFLLGSA